MPIRFRCAYCNQLLGIARRKAGTVVRCPTCAGQVVVPTVETNEPEGQPGEEKQLIFERSDFDELLNPNDSGRAPAQKKTRSSYIERRADCHHLVRTTTGQDLGGEVGSSG